MILKYEDVFEEIIQDIECTPALIVKKKSQEDKFHLWSDPNLRSNLSGNIGAFFVRAFLNQLNIDEHRVFKWRLDNKYRQYQVLNYYVPGCVANTISFSKVMREENGVHKIRQLCESGYFVKSTLGDGTGRANEFDKTTELENILKSDHIENNHLDKWMLQERLNLVKEFRVHTFGRDLLHGLTFKIKGKGLTGISDVDEFVKLLIEKLPGSILEGTLIGWDIGITDKNAFYVIEANFTGFHPEYSPGFQTSGYFGDTIYGSIICAWLNNYFRSKYRISIGSVDEELCSKSKFYKDLLFFIPMFKKEHIDMWNKKKKLDKVIAIIYIGEEISEHYITLLNYFYLEHFAEMYYLIVNKVVMPVAESMFAGNDLIQVMTEDSLFTNDQYALIELLYHERRKQICCYHAVRRLKSKSYFFI